MWFFRRATNDRSSALGSADRKRGRSKSRRARAWSFETLEAREVLSSVAPWPQLPQFVPPAIVSHNTYGVASQISVNMPLDVLNGVAVNVQLTELDANGHLVRNGADTVTLTTTDTSAVLSSNTVTFVNGVANVKVTFATPGTQALVITDTTNAALSTSASTNVGLPDAATHISVYMPQNVPPGKPVYAALVALDAQNHVVGSFSDTVNLTISDPLGTLSSSTVTFKNGYATVKATFGTTGSQTITATDANNALLVGTASVNVASTSPVSVPDVATHFTFFMPQNVNNGQTVSVGVVALDAQNHLVQTFADSVNLTASSVTTVLSAGSVTFANGFASFTAKFVTAGSQTITATDATKATLTSVASTNVGAVDTATHFSLIASQNVNAGQPVYMRLVALDAQNNIVQNYSGSVTVTSSDPNALLPSTVTFRNGVAWVRVVFGTTGKDTLTFTDTSGLLPALTTTSNVYQHSWGFRGWFGGWFWNPWWR